MEILCYALSAAVLVLTGAVISGGVVLPRRLPKEHTAESTPEDTPVSYTHLTLPTIA